MYAIVLSGGKQYKVSEKTVFEVEKLPADDGQTVELPALLVADGDNVRVGNPIVEGVTVTATVLETSKGTKVRGFTYKPAEIHRRHYGHRQWHTRLRVESIQG